MVMENRMTSGEMAKKAGVSQKAIRLYDEKGLLKPTDYSESNYRLYDLAALQILEKIVALKQIGFSLEEIRDNLQDGEAQDIESALKMQLQKMQERRYQIDKVISAIERTLSRKEDKLDWDDVAGIVTKINIDQGADERYWDALKYTSKEMDWYERIFNSLEIKENAKVLDLGCGYGNLWRNNQDRIPEGTKVYGYDIHGSWADEFDKDLQEKNITFPEKVSISLNFSDVDDEETWDEIEKDKEYDLVIAHYIGAQLDDVEKMVERASKVLSDDGLFSFNTSSSTSWASFFKEAFEASGVDTSFIEKSISNVEETRKAKASMLNKYFGKVEPAFLPNIWHYTDSKVILDKIKAMYPDQEKFLNKVQDKLLAYYDQIIEEKGEVTATIHSPFWHCRK